MRKKIYSKVKCVVFDLDGTIYFGKNLADQAVQIIDYAREKAGHVFFATNNSAKTPLEIYEKLHERGIHLTPDEVLTSSFLLAEYLLKHNLHQTITIGTDSLKTFLHEKGISTDSKKAKAFVVGYDPKATLKDLDYPLNYLPKDYLFIAANFERSYPIENGWKTPGAGAMVKMAEFVLQKETDVFVGKPHSVMLKWIANKFELTPQEILMVGDQYKSDIQMAENFGAHALLVTNGEANPYPCKHITALAQLKELL
ncbi:MAG: HAD-IIA family hydrolase [Elusimicrobiaceae bacterium]|nr:HAD-IIA family hydrolase [Elusimicrobiaceae bacterium]